MDIENINNHRFTIDNYIFDLSYHDYALYFHVTCSNTFTKYTATINPETIKHNKNIEFFFATPEDLYTYFTGGCTNNLHLKESTIMFSIETKLGKSIKTYDCAI
jgi:hypothetical protein